MVLQEQTLQPVWKSIFLTVKTMSITADVSNVKITYPQDLAIAEHVLAQKGVQRLSKEVLEAELNCAHCHKETLHELVYAGRLLVSTTCSVCNYTC